MDLFDSFALMGRKYEPQTSLRTGSRRFTLSEVLETFNRNAILELTTIVDGKTSATKQPDPVRKIKVSLLDDGISALRLNSSDWFEVFRTAPSGDLSRVRIVAHSAEGNVTGEIRFVAGRRSYAQYFEEDPIFKTIRDQEK